MRTSEYLEQGELYSRQDLRDRFDIADQTINTGIFRPAGHDSVWLFVTETKTDDMTPYVDRLDGDVLHWQGQTSGTKDKLIIEHDGEGLELLLFYRVAKDEHPGYAFRYEGPFSYVSHTGAEPASFTLERVRPAGTGMAGSAASERLDVVQRLFQLRKSAQHAVVSEAGRTGLQRRMHVPDAIESWLLAKIDECRRSDEDGPSLIVLSGNAGDGKSDLLARLQETLGPRADIACVPDATQADEPSEDQQSRLSEFFGPFADEASGADPRLHLIAMNTGMAISFFEKLRRSGEGPAFDQLEAVIKHELGLRDEAPAPPEWRYAVVNLDRRDLLGGSPSLLSGMLDKLDPGRSDGLFGSAGADCAQCGAREVCFVRTNLELLRQPVVRENLAGALREASLQEDVHLSPRNAWDFLSIALAGDSQLLEGSAGPSCEGIRRLGKLPAAEAVPVIHRRLLWHSVFEGPGAADDSRGPLANSLSAVDAVRHGGRRAHAAESAIYAGPESERKMLLELALAGESPDPVLANIASAIESPDVFASCRGDLLDGVTRRAALLSEPASLHAELRDPDAEAFLSLLADYSTWRGGAAPPSLLAFTDQVLHGGVARIFGVPVGAETYFRLDSFAPTTSYPAFVEVDMDVVAPVPDEDVRRGREWLSVLAYRPRAIVVSVGADAAGRGGSRFRVDLPLFRLLRRVVEGYSASSVDLEAFYALRFACERLGGSNAASQEIWFREASSGRFFSLRERRILGTDVLSFEEAS